MLPLSCRVERRTSWFVDGTWRESGQGSDQVLTAQFMVTWGDVLVEGNAVTGTTMQAFEKYGQGALTKTEELAGYWETELTHCRRVTGE